MGLERLEDRALLSAGSLDPTFGDGGLVTANFGYAPSGDEGRDVIAVQADGKIVLAGSSDGWSSGADFAVARYNPDGSLDTSFGTEGKVTTDFSLSTDYAYGVAIDGDGKIVVAGSTYQS